MKRSSGAQSSLPWQGLGSAAAHSSYLGARQAAETRDDKRERLLAYVRRRERVTDEQLEMALKFRRSTVCSVRNGLVHDGFICQDGHHVFTRREEGQLRKKTHTYWRATTEHEREMFLEQQQRMQELMSDGDGMAGLA